MGTVSFPKTVSEAMRLKVLVAALASHQSPAMDDNGKGAPNPMLQLSGSGVWVVRVLSGTAGEPSYQTEAGPVTGISAVCKCFASAEAGTPLLPAKASLPSLPLDPHDGGSSHRPSLLGRWNRGMFRLYTVNPCSFGV